MEAKNALTLHLASVSTHPDFPDKEVFIIDSLVKKYVSMTAGSLWSSLNTGVTSIDYSY